MASDPLTDCIPDDCTLGSYLREIRQDRNLSRDAVAAALGVTSKTIEFWEADQHRPNRGNRATLAAWLSGDTTCLHAEDPTPDTTADSAQAGRVPPEHPHEAATPLGLLGVRDLDRVAFTLEYRLPDDPPDCCRTRHFAGEAVDVFDDPEWADLSVPGGTALYLRPDVNPQNEVLIVLDADNRLVDVELGPDGNRQPVVAQSFSDFARARTTRPHPAEAHRQPDCPAP